MNDLKKQLKKLTGVVGVGFKWSISMPTCRKVQPTILQIADENIVFLIDLLVLSSSNQLDTVLKELFLSKNLIFTGVDLKNDLKKVQQAFPDLTFCEHIPRFLDP